MLLQPFDEWCKQSRSRYVIARTMGWVFGVAIGFFVLTLAQTFILKNPSNMADRLVFILIVMVSGGIVTGILSFFKYKSIKNQTT